MLRRRWSTGKKKIESASMFQYICGALDGCDHTQSTLAIHFIIPQNDEQCHAHYQVAHHYHLYHTFYTAYTLLAALPSLAQFSRCDP